MRKKIELLEDHSELAADMLQSGIGHPSAGAIRRHIPKHLAIDLDASAVNGLEGHQDPEEGRFA